MMNIWLISIIPLSQNFGTDFVLAIDGSKAEIPNSVENRERFGKSNNQHSELGQIRALVMVCTTF